MTAKNLEYPREELWLLPCNREGEIQPNPIVNLGHQGTQLEGDELLKAINHAKHTDPLPHASWAYLPFLISISLENGNEIADIVN